MNLSVRGCLAAGKRWFFKQPELFCAVHVMHMCESLERWTETDNLTSGQFKHLDVLYRSVAVVHIISQPTVHHSLVTFPLVHIAST